MPTSYSQYQWNGGTYDTFKAARINMPQPQVQVRAGLLLMSGEARIRVMITTCIAALANEFRSPATPQDLLMCMTLDVSCPTMTDFCYGAANGSGGYGHGCK